MPDIGGKERDPEILHKPGHKLAPSLLAPCLLVRELTSSLSLFLVVLSSWIWKSMAYSSPGTSHHA